MAKKKKRLLDKLYNGAFENAELSAGSKRALTNSGLILLFGAAFLISKIRK
jgi:hypothetical protein